MSRIGNDPIKIPEGVTVNFENNIITAKGKLGELSAKLTDDVEVQQENNLIWIKPLNNTTVPFSITDLLST